MIFTVAIKDLDIRITGKTGDQGTLGSPRGLKEVRSFRNQSADKSTTSIVARV